MDLFLDGAGGTAREAIHLLFADEFVREGELAPNPSLGSAVRSGPVVVLSLEDLVHIKLTAYRDKDRVHLRDLIAVGLVDDSWLSRLPPLMAARLQKILDTPDG